MNLRVHSFLFIFCFRLEFSFVKRKTNVRNVIEPNGEQCEWRRLYFFCTTSRISFAHDYFAWTMIKTAAYHINSNNNSNTHCALQPVKEEQLRRAPRRDYDDDVEREREKNGKRNECIHSILVNDFYFVFCWNSESSRFSGSISSSTLDTSVRF